LKRGIGGFLGSFANLRLIKQIIKTTTGIKTMLKLKNNQKGMNLIGLLLGVLIMGIIAYIMLSRFEGSETQSQEELSETMAEVQKLACKGNLSAINIAIEQYHEVTGYYPVWITDVTEDKAYFPSGPPKCPKGGTYSLSDSNRAECSLADSDGHRL